MKSTLFVAFALCSLLSITGCIEPPPRKQSNKPFSAVELESCLGVMIDMSGSFSTSWNDRAHRLFMQLLDELFSAGAGSESRVVLGQLSGSEPIVLFEGRPQELRRRFRTPEDLNSFLLENSDPSSSKVNHSTRQFVDYVGSMNGVGINTRLISVILSDMTDNEPDAAVQKEAKTEMIASLKDYRSKNGAIALYFVAQDQAKNWRDILGEAGFQSGEFVIETSLSESPQLPQLD